jgi:DHA1 family bicyclomycin/chloramphenicol resistance-like MFS transporter
VAGLIAPLVMHSAVAMAIVSLGMLGLGLQAWLWAHRRWPDIGRSVVNPDH